MQRFKTIPKSMIVFAIFILCCCFMTFIKKCLRIQNLSDKSNPTLTEKSNPKVTVTNYWASWCGYSNSYLPEWTKFKKGLNNSSIDAIANDLDCGNKKDDKIQKECRASEVQGFPTVIIKYKQGGKEKKIDFKGGRSKTDLDAEVDRIIKLAD